MCDLFNHVRSGSSFRLVAGITLVRMVVLLCLLGLILIVLLGMSGCLAKPDRNEQLARRALEAIAWEEVQSGPGRRRQLGRYGMSAPHRDTHGPVFIEGGVAFAGSAKGEPVSKGDPIVWYKDGVLYAASEAAERVYTNLPISPVVIKPSDFSVAKVF